MIKNKLKFLFQVSLIMFTVLISLLTQSIIINAQTTQNNQTTTPNQTVDLGENNLLPDCNLSKLQNTTIQQNNVVETLQQENILNDLNSEVKKKYFQGCIQSAFRFIIILAALTSVLKLAYDGIRMFVDRKAVTNTRKTVTDLIIGLLLLTLGWNLLPIFNQSFNNLNFLQLPSLNYCTITLGCTPEKVLKERRYRECTNRYNIIIEQKEYNGNNDDKSKLAKCIQEYCSEPDIYKTVNREVCEDRKTIIINIDKAIADGIKLRAARNASGGSTGSVPDSQLISEYEKLIKDGRIKQKDNDTKVLWDGVKSGEVKPQTIRVIVEIARNSYVDYLEVWSLLRRGDPQNHGVGAAIDISAFGKGGKKITAIDAWQGRYTTEWLAFANMLKDTKNVFQIIVAGDIQNKLKATPGFTAGRGQGTIDNIRITTTPGRSDTTQRHEDHWHIDIFK
jgi:hypothetical protein